MDVLDEEVSDDRIDPDQALETFKQRVRTM